MTKSYDEPVTAFFKVEATLHRDWKDLHGDTICEILQNVEENCDVKIYLFRGSYRFVGKLEEMNKVKETLDAWDDKCSSQSAGNDKQMKISCEGEGSARANCNQPSDIAKFDKETTNAEEAVENSPDATQSSLNSNSDVSVQENINNPVDCPGLTKSSVEEEPMQVKKVQNNIAQDEYMAEVLGQNTHGSVEKIKWVTELEIQEKLENTGTLKLQTSSPNSTTSTPETSSTSSSPPQSPQPSSGKADNACVHARRNSCKCSIEKHQADDNKAITTTAENSQSNVQQNYLSTVRPRVAINSPHLTLMATDSNEKQDQNVF